MRRSWLALTMATLLVPVGTDRARAQDAPRWMVNPYAGILLADEGGLEDLADAEEIDDVSIDPAALIGARLGYAPGSRWSFEAAYGYSPVTIELSDLEESFELDVSAHLYYGAVNYAFPTSSSTEIFVSAGAGGFFVKAQDEGLFEGAEDSSHDLLVNLGGGLLWWMNERLAVRADVKDHIDFCKAAEDLEDFSACPLDDTTLHHIELSGGVSFLLGRS